MFLTILSYIGIFFLGLVFGIGMIAILAANNQTKEKSDEEQIEYLKKY